MDDPGGDRPRTDAEEVLWGWARALHGRRRFLAAVTGGVAVASAVISLLLPKWYLATSTLLLPEARSRAAVSSFLAAAAPGAAALFGNAEDSYARYLAILGSRTVMAGAVDRFDLLDVYGIDVSATARDDALERLRRNVQFTVDMELGFLAVNVWDRDPRRAADMANYFVAELNRTNTRLGSENASSYRHFVERRYRETEAALDSARARLQRFQEAYGVIELDAQAAAFLELIASYRALAVQSEIEYQALVRDFGTDNPQVRSVRNRVEAARRLEREIMAGDDVLLPVPVRELPEVARRYAEIVQETMVEARVLEFARPMLEQAIFEEEREAPAVQVLDEAIPPVKKAKPQRKLIVISSTLSAVIVAGLYVLGMDWLRRNHDLLARRLGPGAG